MEENMPATSKEPGTMKKIKHILLTGESLATEKRRAERKSEIEMGDKTYRFLLIFFFLLFWVIMIWKAFV